MFFDESSNQASGKTTAFLIQVEQLISRVCGDGIKYLANIFGHLVVEFEILISIFKYHSDLSEIILIVSRIFLEVKTIFLSKLEHWWIEMDPSEAGLG